MPHPLELSRRRRVQVAILASLIIHVLAISVYQRWGAGKVAQILRPVHLETVQVGPELDRFRPASPAGLPEVEMEMVEPGVGPARLPDVAAIEQLLAPEVPDVLPAIEDALTRRGKSGQAGIDDTLTLEEQIAKAFDRRRVQRERRWLYALPSADTTDQQTRSRRLAEAIVDSAIAAMGGLERMQAVVDKTVQVWFHDSKDHQWKMAGKQYYWRGLKYGENIGTAVSRGYDGRRSWYSRYGIDLPAPNLRRHAERWDFLSQFRGDGILLEYLGVSGTAGGLMHVIRVTDTMHGGEREAFFNKRTHLLSAVREGKRLTEYSEYREVGGIRIPYELWVGPTRYRHQIQLNSGLDPDLFEAPEPRTWSRESVRMVVLEHVGEDLADSTLTLKIAPIWQKPVPPGERPAARKLDALSLNLLNTYFLEKFRAAGMAAEGDEDRWLEVVIERYYIAPRPPPWPPRHQFIFTVTLRNPMDQGWVWEERVEYVLPLKSPLINDETGDSVTFGLLGCVARGLTVLLGQDPGIAGDGDSTAVRPAGAR